MPTEIANFQEVRGFQAGKVPFLYSLFSSPIFTGEQAWAPTIPVDQRVKGCDVSRWNGEVNFVVMVGAGGKYVYIKCSQGTTWTDPLFLRNRAAARGVLPQGHYHFLVSDKPGSDQANYFCDKIESGMGELPPVLDVELLTVQGYVIKAFCVQTKVRLGMYPVIYTSNYFWSKVPSSIEKSWVSTNCELFVAHWGTDTPYLPTGWTNYSVHQYSADGNGLGVTYGAPPPPAADADMDLDRTSLVWYNRYVPPVTKTLEERVTALEIAVRGLGGDV